MLSLASRLPMRQKPSVYSKPSAQISVVVRTCRANPSHRSAARPYNSLWLLLRDVRG